MNIQYEEKLKEVCKRHGVEYVGLQRYSKGTPPLFIFFNTENESTRTIYYSPSIETVEKRLVTKLQIIEGENK
jgi:hypothetical protein